MQHRLVLLCLPVLLSGCTSEQSAKAPSIASQSPPAVAKPNPIERLEASPFCQTYRCGKPDSWDIRTGGKNYSYELNVRPRVSFEAVVEDGAIDYYGLGFGDERSNLTPKDLEIIWSALALLDGYTPTPADKQFVQANIGRRVKQIDSAASRVVGAYRVWAGRVLHDYIIVIRKDLPSLAKPEFSEAGRAGRTHFVVVAADRIGSDEKLLEVARYFSHEDKRTGGRGEVHVWFWSDPKKVAARLPMTDAQLDARAAQVLINPSKQIERVERRD